MFPYSEVDSYLPTECNNQQARCKWLMNPPGFIQLGGGGLCSHWLIHLALHLQGTLRDSFTTP